MTPVSAMNVAFPGKCETLHKLVNTIIIIIASALHFILDIPGKATLIADTGMVNCTN